MSKHRMPTRPGNDHTYHGDRDEKWDTIEKIIFHVCVPIGSIIVLGMAVGLAWVEVAKWIG